MGRAGPGAKRRPMSRRWRVHHEPPVAVGDMLELSPEQAHHIRSVLRLQGGDRLSVFDGAGGEWVARIETMDRRRVQLVVEQLLAGEATDPDFEVVLFQAYCRPERMEWLLQKGCEVGLHEVRLFRGQRGEGPPASDSRVARWRRVMIEACKQCGRRRVPGIVPIKFLPCVPDGVQAFLADPETEISLAGQLRDSESTTCWVAVGPEAGLDDEERAAAIQGGWLPVSLGPRVLRTETAGMAATVLILAARGDLA